MGMVCQLSANLLCDWDCFAGRPRGFVALFSGRRHLIQENELMMPLAISKVALGSSLAGSRI